MRFLRLLALPVFGVAVAAVLLIPRQAASLKNCDARPDGIGQVLELEVVELRVDGQSLPTSHLPGPGTDGGYSLANDNSFGDIWAVLYDPKAPGFVRREELPWSAP